MTAITPDKFAGQFQDNPQTSWWRTLTTYFDATNTSAADAIKLVPLFLTNKALSWYHALPVAIRNNFTHLSAAFKTRFEPHDTQKWQLWDQLESRKHQLSEPIEDYISEIQELAARLDCDDDYIMQKIIRGLSPTLQPLVIMREPSTLAETISYARTLQHAAPANQPPGLDITKAAIDAAIQPLTEQLQKLHLDVNTAFNARVHVARTESHTEGRRTPSPWRRSHSRSPSPAYDRRHAQMPRSRSDYSPRQDRHYSPAYRQPQRYSSPHDSSRQRQMSSRFPSPYRRPDDRARPCNGCGRNCASRRQCPAWDRHCTQCHKVGHFANVCRGTGSP